MCTRVRVSSDLLYPFMNQIGQKVGAEFVDNNIVKNVMLLF